MGNQKTSTASASSKTSDLSKPNVEAGVPVALISLNFSSVFAVVKIV